MKSFEATKALVLFLRAAVLRPAAFTRLALWDIGLLLVVTVPSQFIILSMGQPDPADPAAIVGLFGVSAIGGLVQAAVAFAVFTVWVRLFSTGTAGGTVPFQFGKPERMGLITMLAITGLYIAAIMAVMVLSALLQLVGLGGIIVMPLFLLAAIVMIVVGLRLNVAVPMGMLENRFMLREGWDRTAPIMGGLITGFLILLFLGIVAALVQWPIGGVLASLLGLNFLTLAVDGIGGSAVIYTLVMTTLAVLIGFPLRMMGYGLNIYAAMYLLGLDNDWTRAIVELEEAEDRGADS